jgi:hypothetical protein
MAEALNPAAISIFTCPQFMDFHSMNIPYLCHLFIRRHTPKMTRPLNYKKKTGPEGFLMTLLTLLLSSTTSILHTVIQLSDYQHFYDIPVLLS